MKRRIGDRWWIRRGTVDSKTRYSYETSDDANDRKREGRSLTIKKDSFSVKLGGAEINSIVGILREAGEIE